MAKEAYWYGKRGLLIYIGKTNLLMVKEAYGKRGLRKWQKRPVDMAKEAYRYGKTDLLIWQKRPIDMSIPVLRAAPTPPLG
jgi:hypothetical protein